ncbi:MAG: CBS domain-containing protein [Chloroflexi bacterium]|nr:CBS domain-containing protein [Chloroflexota bacterium]
MRVRDAMVFGAVAVADDVTVTEAAKLMNDQDVGMLVLEREGHSEGVITDRDIVVKCLASDHDPAECVVENHVSRPIITVSIDADVFEAVSLLREHRIKRLGVSEEGTLVGVVSITDITQAMDQPLHDLIVGSGRARTVPVEMLVGHVTHYYTKIGVATVSLEAPLHVGDNVHLFGHTTNHTQVVGSIQIDGRDVKTGFRGDQVGLAVSARVRVGDSVYVESE